MEIRIIVTVAYFVLAIYMYGGGVMSTLAYYQSWKLVGEEDFAAVHSSVSKRILPFFGPVLVLLVVVNVLLIWFHHPAISTWLIVFTAAIHLLMGMLMSGRGWRLTQIQSSFRPLRLEHAKQQQQIAFGACKR